jgi:hypothetical protein
LSHAGSTVKCESNTVRLYLEYYNHTLGDYLLALRANKSVLTLGEAMYVTNSLAEGALVLRSKD